MDVRDGGSTHVEFKIPARGLIGYRSEFMTDTNGNGIMNNLFAGYEPYKGDIQMREHGSIIAHETGESTGEIKRYYNDYKHEKDYNIAQYGNLLVYYSDIYRFYADCGYKTTAKFSTAKIWDVYLRQIGYIVRTYFLA